MSQQAEQPPESGLREPEHDGDRVPSLRRSVRAKLMAIVLLTTVIALVAAGAAMLTHDLTVYRHSFATDLATEAGILALSTAPALAFDDREVANRNLAALEARPGVLASALYNGRGQLYAQYVRAGQQPPPLRLQSLGPDTRLSGELIEYSQPLIRHGERLGSIFLRARYDVRGRIQAYIKIFGLVLLISLMVALALSFSLQRVITRPLEAMAAVARRVVTGRDYSLRAKKAGDDEIGVVVSAFNRMMDEIQSRTDALEKSNAALQREVLVRETAEQALGRANARLESAMEAAEIGSWVWDLRKNELWADRNLAALYGVAYEGVISGDPENHRQQIHPDDLALVKRAEMNALRSGVLTPTDFRIIQPDESERWVTSRGRVQFDANGEPLLLAGLFIDITAQKVAEQALRKSENLYRAIGESIDYGVWVADASGRYLYASDSFLSLTGLTAEAFAANGGSEALHPEDAVATRLAWEECVRSGSAWYREYRVRGRDGQFHPILAQGVPMKDERGEITGWAGINLDIARLKQTEEALRIADRRKDEFLATLAHELRNPLSPIRHAVALLDTPQATERQRQWGREVIGRQVQRMALLLDDLLDVSRITRGRLELKKDYVDLQSIVSAAIETARPLIESKRHELAVVLPEEKLVLEVDPLRLSQALSNLLTNAAKYTDESGQIELKVALDAESVLMTVKDNGIGLAADSLPTLFEMFSQVSSAMDRAQGGLGIGLALVKGLVALHGGTVSVESAGLGRGSQFGIRLPRSVLVGEREERDSPQAHAKVTPMPHCKVLVADDNRDAADSLGAVLELHGHRVWIAHSGSEALRLGARAQPDVILLDIGMPDLSGYEVARRIRQEAWGRRPLLIAITGWGQESDKLKARASGFDEHFTKPITPAEVQQRLARFLAGTLGRAPHDGQSPGEREVQS